MSIPSRKRGLARGRIAAHAAALATALAFAVAGAAQAAPMPGLQTHLLWGGVDSAEVDRQLDRAKEAGAEIVRVDVGWASIEPDGKGKYSNWHLARLDGVVDKARARGIKVLVTFWETPCWASSAPEELKQGCAGSWWGRGVQRYAPTNPADYADALAFVAKRYGDRVEAYEVWNEPNQDYYFKAADPIAAYADMVKATYPVVKRAEPGATVIAGSLADADFGFTEKLYDQGIKGSFDAYSVHPYSGDRSPLALSDDRWIKTSFIRGVPAVRDLLVRKGDADKPLWLTEFGWSTCTARGGESWANCVDEGVQADYLRTAFRQMPAWDYVKAGIWFNLKDTSADAGDRVDNYGLLEHDGSPKQAFAAFRTAAADVTSGKVDPPPPLPTPSTQPQAQATAPAPAPTKTGGEPMYVRSARTIAAAVAQEDGEAGSDAAGGSTTGSSQPVRLSLQTGAAGRRFLTARGRVRGRTSGTIKLTALYAKGASRLAPVSTRTARLRRGTFKTTVARFRRGRWRVEASLAGTPSAAESRQFRLEDDKDPAGDPAQAPPGVEDDGGRALEDTGAPDDARDGQEEAGPALVAEARFGNAPSPGPLKSGGYVSATSGAERGTVSFIQSRLAAAGFATAGAGRFDRRTEAAVRRFQEAHGLVVDGIVGRQTIAALKEYGSETR